MLISKVKVTLCAFSSFLPLFLTGCALNTTATPEKTAGLAITGSVHGGQQPIIGSRIYMLAAATTGYGAASVSVLLATDTGQSDSVGAYVPTGVGGSFNIPTYTCTPNTQVYLLSLGGNPGAGANSASGLMAALGNCPASGNFDSTVPFVWINEVSTVAAAYAMSGFAVDATHVASSGTTLAQTGIASAFVNTLGVVPISTGVARNFTPAGNGTVPYMLVNTLANILASCINSTGPASPNCTTLFANAKSNGSSGTTATNTATAAINIAHNPGANVATLYNLTPPTGAFAPAMPTQPNDFTIGINFRNGQINGPVALAVDATGSVWIVNGNNAVISKLSPDGSVASGANGYSAASLAVPAAVAIDLSGNAWVVDNAVNGATKFSTSGTTLSPAAGYTGGGQSNVQFVAIDPSNNVWTANYNNSASQLTNSGVALSPAGGYTGGGLSGTSGTAIDTTGAAWFTNSTGAPTSVSKLSSAGVAISPATGYFGAGINSPFSVAIDSGNNAWIANFNNASLSRLSTTGAAISPTAGYTGGGLNQPFSVSLDGAGNVWAANFGNNTVSEHNSAGGSISPSTGYLGGILTHPLAVAVDGSGNVWIANSSDVTVTMFLGAAVPVVTPIVAGAKNNTLATRP